MDSKRMTTAKAENNPSSLIAANQSQVTDVASKSTAVARATIETSMGELFSIAADAKYRSGSDANQALVAIVFSIIAMDATLNDLMAFCSFPSVVEKSPLLGQLSEELKQLDQRRANLVTRLEKIHEVLTRAALDKNSEPMKGLQCLAQIRNEITHRQAITGVMHGNSLTGLTVDRVKRNFQPYLISKGLISERETIEFPWQYSVKKPNVAEWALDTCIDCVERVFLLLPDSQPRRSLMSEFTDRVKGFRSSRPG